MRSFQASKRTGFLEVELKEVKLQIQGQAVIVFEGRLAI
jgi:predicted PhzF superfamily epimerase YddE/YHI9